MRSWLISFRLGAADMMVVILRPSSAFVKRPGDLQNG
jgi:hypothetical protein